MITAQRQRRRRRAAAAVASVAIGLGLVGAVATPASAEDGSAMYQGFVEETTASVTGTFGGGSEVRGIRTGLRILDIEGEDEHGLSYCVQVDVDNDTSVPYIEQDFDELVSDTVARILGSYYPIGTGPAGYELESTGDEALDARLMAAATQSAIWHFTDDFDLTIDEGENNPVIIAYYEIILQAVADRALPPLSSGTLTLSIDGPEDVDAIPGELVGPYVVNTTASLVELTTTEGLTIHNEDGSPFEGPAEDGDELWLKAAAAGSGTLSASASGIESGGRVFGGERVQDLAFVVVTPVTVSTTIDLHVGPPPTTAPPSTTSTTVGTTTTESTVPETTVTVPTTTVTTTPQASGGLPVTGTQTMLLVAAALVLLIVGGAFGLAAKRRADGGTT
jgi:TQXA domain-containing protein/LPXTG-motif cell wall-anchored protein